MQATVITLHGANIANVQATLLLTAEKGLTRSHNRATMQILVTIQILATIVGLTPTTAILEGVLDAKIQHTLQSIVITMTTGQIFS